MSIGLFESEISISSELLPTIQRCRSTIDCAVNEYNDSAMFNFIEKSGLWIDQTGLKLMGLDFGEYPYGSK
ncbi:hypothetical protein HHK36_017347 [Tetracentron sinense]|uniref:Uncharacterized protein n=1 Tax=Tetracentron sinense TaxID=13715 RepID=A0A834Z173_TETSI|nr:hypothetical protein HHK36_017347 [Tetracentron sinense]